MTRRRSPRRPAGDDDLYDSPVDPLLRPFRDWDGAPSLVHGVGSASTWTTVPKADRRRPARGPIGFRPPT